MTDGWLRLQFRVDASYFDDLADLLEGCLALSVSIENDGEDEFFEVAFPERPTWKKIRVHALFHDTVDPEAIIDFVQTTLFHLNPVPVVIEKFEDEDWVRVWLDQLEPFHVSNDLWVVPSWLTVPDENAKNLIIDPGLAFGTGSHATTFLCLEYLAKNDFTGQRVLDFGAGSGILSIASLIQGASSAVAVDIDPLAVAACADNAKINGVFNSLVSLTTDDFLASDFSNEQYNLVIANILAEVLIDNAQMLLGLLANEGRLLLSGILEDQQEKVIKNFEKIAQVDFKTYTKEGWLLILIAKKAS